MMLFGRASELWEIAVEADAHRRRKFGLPPVEGDPYAFWAVDVVPAVVPAGVAAAPREGELELVLAAPVKAEQ